MCLLPAMLWSDISQEAQGGFVNAATGAFSPDPHSVQEFDNSRELFHTVDKPYLYARHPGDPALTAGSYDAAQHRWLPVPREWVSPGGGSYAYAVIQPGVDQGVHIVDVAAGTDRVVSGTSGDPDARGMHYSVVAYQPDGIYLSRANQLTGGGLWLLNPGSASIARVSTDAPFLGTFVAGKEAWWTTDRDPFVAHQYLTGVAGQHAETWFQRPGSQLHIVGVDAGRAVALNQSAAAIELWLLATPNASTLISTTPSDSAHQYVVPFKTAVPDAAGWWVGSQVGVFLASSDGLRRASSTPAVVVGGCS